MLPVLTNKITTGIKMPDPYKILQQQLRDAFGDGVESYEDVEEKFMKMLDKHDAPEELREVTKEAMSDLQGEMDKLKAAVKVQNAFQAMSIITNSERVEIMNSYCTTCGAMKGLCNCESN